MNWDAIGAVGEILGAIAVVATLLYLARQIRAQQASSADANRIQRGIGVRDMMMAMAENPGMSSSWAKTNGLAEIHSEIAQELGATTDEAESVINMSFYWMWLHWTQWASSSTDRDMEELRHVVGLWYSAPPMSIVWRLHPNVALFEPEFRDFVGDAVSAVT